MKMPHVGGLQSEAKSRLPVGGMAVHAIKHKEADSCAEVASWPPGKRYNQDMVIGESD